MNVTKLLFDSCPILVLLRSTTCFLMLRLTGFCYRAATEWLPRWYNSLSTGDTGDLDTPIGLSVLGDDTSQVVCPTSGRHQSGCLSYIWKTPVGLSVPYPFGPPGLPPAPPASEGSGGSNMQQFRG